MTTPTTPYLAASNDAPTPPTQPLSVGDVVTLKSGGEFYIVSEVLPAGRVRVYWTNENEDSLWALFTKILDGRVLRQARYEFPLGLTAEEVEIGAQVALRCTHFDAGLFVVSDDLILCTDPGEPRVQIMWHGPSMIDLDQLGSEPEDHRLDCSLHTLELPRACLCLAEWDDDEGDDDDDDDDEVSDAGGTSTWDDVLA